MRHIVLTVLSLSFISFSSGPVHAAEYAVDPSHSSALFRVHHLGASYVYGMMPEVEGTITFDPSSADGNKAQITVKTETLSTFNERRDNHLKSPDFFNTKQFPTITYTSKSWKKVDDHTFEVSGDITLLGVTKPLTATVKYTGTGKNQRGQELVGFETTFVLDRTQFGMTYGVAETGGLGKEATVTLAVEAIRQ